MSAIRSGIDPKSMLVIIIACTLVAAFAAMYGFAYATESSIYNNSTIHFESQNNISNSPFRISSGDGYYSSHPITYDSAIESRTQVTNKGSTSSLHRVVESARGLSGSSEFMISDSHYRQGDSEYSAASATQMKIDETVTEGKVHIGALQADDLGGDAGKSGIDPMMNGWKKPALEIEEDYIGTYHISRNIAINTTYGRKNTPDDWLACCVPNYFSMLIRNPPAYLPLADADAVFGYNFMNGE